MTDQENTTIPEKNQEPVVLHRKFHFCLLCANSFNISKPISLTDSGLHITFSCSYAEHGESKLFAGKPQPMIYDMIKNKCWVDGSSSIPNHGCENLSKNIHVTETTFINNQA